LEFPQEDLRLLIDLGLTLVQAKIFLALAQTGTMKVKTIAQVSKVARPDVYRALSKIQEEGLVEKELVRPALFRAIPTEVALTRLMERHTMKNKELKTKTANLIRKYKKKKDSHLPQSDFVFVPSKEALFNKLKKAIDSTQKSIDVSTTCKRFAYACYNLSEPLRNAWNRGVKGRAVIDNTEGNNCETIKKYWRPPCAEIKYIPTVPRTVMAMYDKKEVFIFIKPTAEMNESPALWSNNPSLLAMAEDCFEILWSTAMESPKHHLDSTKD
jgi:sugar-specific transcriptional regulator TrmB